MHRNRYVMADGKETVSKFDKTMPEKPRRRYEFSVWRNQQRILFLGLRKTADADGNAEDVACWNKYINKYMNKYRNPKGRWTRKES